MKGIDFISTVSEHQFIVGYTFSRMTHQKSFAIIAMPISNIIISWKIITNNKYGIKDDCL